MVGINPIVRSEVPQTARAIIDRIGEISFNSSFMGEVAAIAFFEELMQSRPADRRFRRLFVHGIGDEALGAFGASSKMNNASRLPAPSARDRRARRRALAGGKPRCRRKALDGRSVGARSDAARLAHRPIHHQSTSSRFKHENRRRPANAYAMPLTNPSFPRGPYRFFNREYLIVTYRTDPEALRAVVPEPLSSTRAAGEIRVDSHARFDRIRRLHRIRTGDSGAFARRGRRLRAFDVSGRRCADRCRPRAVGLSEEAREAEDPPRRRGDSRHAALWRRRCARSARLATSTARRTRTRC